METVFPKRLLPTLPMLAESLREAGWRCEMTLADKTQSYRGIRLYHPRQTLYLSLIHI